VSRGLLFLLAQCVPLLFGIPIAVARGWNALLSWTWFAAAYLAGSPVLAVTAIVLSAVGIHWTVVSVVLAGGVVAAVIATTFRGPVSPGRPGRMGVPAPALLGVGIVAVFAMLATATSLGNSADFTFFWGPKAVLFASSRGIDFGALAGPFANYGHITYPTLWPTVMAFSAMLAGHLPWRLAPMLTPAWLLLSVPLVFVLLRRLLGPR